MDVGGSLFIYQPGTKVLVFFDADCGICKKSVEWLSKSIDSTAIHFISNLEIERLCLDKNQLTYLMQKSQEMMLAFDIVNNRILFGYDCFVKVLNSSSKYRRRLLSFFMRSRAVKFFGKHIYAWVAKNRKYFKSGETSCGI